MKNLILILGLTVSTLVSYSQKLVVVLDTIQDIEWPLNISLIEAEKNNLVKYTDLGVGHNVLTFDNQKKIMTLINGNGKIIYYKITEFIETKTGFKIKTIHKNYTTKMVITEQLNGGYLFTVMYDTTEGDTVSEGYFSKNIKLRKN